MKKILLLFLVAALHLAINSCSSESGKNKADRSDLDKIFERGKIVAITGYNAYSYFIYKGQPMGFEHDLVRRLADHLKLDIEIKVVRDINEMFDMLNSGEGDLIAFNLTVTKDRQEKLAFTDYLNTTRQVLVQRRPQNWREYKSHQIERKLIRNPLDLEGKTVYVRNGSVYLTRLQNLSEEIGGDINIVEAEADKSIEDLIEMVSNGEIDYTISDDNIARLSQAYFSNIDINTFISFPQRIAWAVRKTSPALLDTVNHWIDSVKKEVDYYALYNKYYKNRSAYRTRVKSEYFSKTGGKISRFDDVIKKYADNLNWDWRILASLIYQESRFRTDVKSWAGASGLMQLMPETAAQFGVEDLSNPEKSLEAGVSYLNYLDNFWSEMVPDSTERVKFVLASYNIGPGHIVDARNLAEKYGADPNKWEDNVEKFLLNKSKEKFYNDSVVKLGYARGVETVKYVREVLDRYEQYKQFIG